MANIRAYKIAEELGIDRSEFVEKAAVIGVTLKSPMASIDGETADLLRQKLGGVKKKGPVTERRVETRAGGAVIRRRKKIEPVPEPVVVAEVPASEVETREAVPVVEPIEAEAPALPEAPSEPEPVVPIPAPGPERSSQPAFAAKDQAGTGPESGQGQGPSPGADRGAAKQRKRAREVVNFKEQERLASQATSRGALRRQVMLEPRNLTSPRRKRRDAPAKPVAKSAPQEVKRVARVEGSVAVGELARMLGAKAPDVQRKLMALGTMVSINQAIDIETATKVAAEFGYEVQDVGFKESVFLEELTEAADSSTLEGRPPVITVMGHVDHGKTSLLDALRETDVAAREDGGITQHVGAYQASIEGKKLTFIDTPGHAAFTQMRARGADATDIVVLVVAATEGIMPQTIEAIDHSKSAGVPILVAINKCDLPGSDPQQVRQRLMEHDLVCEEFGGDVISVEVSATKHTGLDKLLEMLTLQAELLELKADPGRRAAGVVLEANLDKGRGPVATVLVQEGTLCRGDAVVVGTMSGRVRAMEDENRTRLKEAGPSRPVQLVGLSGVPEAGDPFHVVASERIAKDIVDHRLAEGRKQSREPQRPMVNLEDFFAQAEGGGVKALPLVIKADVQGSVEALRESLLKLSTDSVKVEILHSGVGAVTETDVMLAKASGAIIVAFHVRPDPAGRKAAEGQGVDVRAYKVIYEVTDDVRNAMVGLLPPKVSEAFQGRAEVRETFNIPKFGLICGSHISEGSVRRGSQCRLLRDGVQIYEGRVGSLKRFKDDAREVNAGFECGIGIDGYNDVKIGDVIETYVLEETPATLE
ncbi:MAG: translation initiation factor IF-2 [Myxococcales bacterium]|nr:translation initiation factor IF-2 [Myxococcales bacterium]